MRLLLGIAILAVVIGTGLRQGLPGAVAGQMACTARPGTPHPPFLEFSDISTAEDSLLHAVSLPGISDSLSGIPSPWGEIAKVAFILLVLSLAVSVILAVVVACLRLYRAVQDLFL